MKLAAGSCLRSPYPSPTATEVLGLAASCPPCCATPGAAGHWLGRSWKLPAGCGLSSSRITRRSSAGPGFAFMMLHKRRPGWHPRDKVCPRAEPCQELCWRSLAPSRATPPWQGPAQLGTRHSQRGGSHTEPSPGFGLRTWPRLVLTRFAGVPSLLALPCARHRRSLPVPGLSSLNPFTVKSRSRPAAAPPAAAHPGRGGRGGRGRRESGQRGQGRTDQCRPRGRAAPPAPAEPVPGEFPDFLCSPAQGTQTPRRWEGPSGLQPFRGQARWEPQCLSSAVLRPRPRPGHLA